MYRPLFIAFLATISLNACQSQTSGTEEVVLEKQAYEDKFASIGAPQLLDVRTPEEFNAGHIEGAELINFYADDFVQQVEAKFDKSKPLFLYCRSGGRSAKATAKLKARGFEEIYDLRGGYLTW